MPKTNVKQISESSQTILAEDIVFRGQLRFQDSLQINGNFEGKIATTGHLIIGSNAHVRADIEAKEVTVAGKLTGNIRESEIVRIHKAGEIYGDIHTKNLTVDSGSRLNGICVMN